MAKVIITKGLEEEVNKRFKGQSVEVFELMLTLEDQPKKGKIVGVVGGHHHKRAKIWGIQILLHHRRI